MKSKLRCVLGVFAIAAVVVTSSCSAVIGTLDGIVDGTTALEPIVAADAAAGQIPATTAMSVMNYLEEANTAASNSITEWESSDSDQVKIAASPQILPP
jgi:crotonobetainyl-CoA:carnitine CoA-transferase CaiB-like acyl-CoA transferase